MVVLCCLPLLPKVIHSLFFPQVPEEAVCSARLASLPACLSAHRDDLLPWMHSLTGLHCPLRASSQETLSTKSLNRPKSALWKPTVAVLLTTLLASPEIENSYHLMVTMRLVVVPTQLYWGLSYGCFAHHIYLGPSFVHHCPEEIIQPSISSLCGVSIEIQLAKMQVGLVEFSNFQLFTNRGRSRLHSRASLELLFSI